MHALLTEYAARIRTTPPSDLIDAFTADLHAVRLRGERPTWRRLVFECRDHPIHHVLREDPYTHEAVLKPRGYAGDANMLDFVYGKRAPDPSITEFGRALFGKTSAGRTGRSVLARRDGLSTHLVGSLGANPRATVVSVACGHLRELEPIPPSLTRGASIFALDHDPVTLALLPKLHARHPVTPMHGSVLDIIAGTATIPQADLIYAAGLYDYLADETAVKLGRALVARLRPGGMLVIPNLVPDNEEIAFLEFAMAWWMVYRDVDDMRRLGEAIVSDQPGLTAHALVSPDGLIATTVVLREGSRT